MPGWLVIVLVLSFVLVVALLADVIRTGWPEYWVDMVRLRLARRRERRRKGTREEQKQRLIQAIWDYWGDDLKYADRDSRRRFAKELADMIVDNITSKHG